jgi:hypothetical protein
MACLIICRLTSSPRSNASMPRISSEDKGALPAAQPCAAAALVASSAAKPSLGSVPEAVAVAHATAAPAAACVSFMIGADDPVPEDHIRVNCKLCVN